MNNDELSETAQSIVNRAQHWNFEGDCMILQYMEQISKNLEIRAKTTTESLNSLRKNLGRAQISLENTQNSLNALQYTQYVEMRCQEDELSAEPEVSKDEVKAKPEEDLLKVFLQNNLKMLHNCHEKFNFQEDTDEDETEEDTTGENCIYQPRNPYNERLLPHIYGTKMWKENWHVGLCEDGAQNYSGDENSDVYSLSSSSSAENESMESHNTENLSQWTSSVSLNAESSNSNKIGNFLPVNTSIGVPPMLEIPIPKTTSIPIVTDPIAIPENPISPHENIEQPASTGATKKKSLQYKTLNLFDDNDFKSLMSEIADKAQNKHVNEETQGNEEKKKIDLFASRDNSPIRDNLLASTTITPMPRSTVNLFDSPTDEHTVVEQFEDTKKLSTQYEVDLFEDLDNSNYSSSGNFLKDAVLDSTQAKIAKKTMISAKSLFDDDDDGDDDDFLNVFAKSKTTASSTFNASKAPIQGVKNNWNLEENNTKTSPPAARSTLLFGDSEVDDIDFIFSKTDRPQEQKTVKIASQESVPNESVVSKHSTDQYKTVSESKKIFSDDSDNESELIFKQTHRNNEPESIIEIEKTSKSNLPVLEDFDDDNIFSEPTSKNNETNKDNSSSKLIPTFIDNEPPGDIQDQLEKQFSFNKTKLTNVIGGEDDADFVNLFGSNKPKPQIKEVDIFVAEGIDKATSIPSSIKESTEFETDNLNPIINTIPSSESTPVVVKAKISNAKERENQHEVPSETHLKKPSLEQKQNEKSTKTPPPPPPKVNEIEPAVLDVLPPEPHQDIVASKGIIEDDAPSAEIMDVPVKVPTAFDSYSPLFLDEPPDDDDFFQIVSASSIGGTQSTFEGDFYEPAKTTSQKPTETRSEVQAQKAQSYNIGLFSEIPPEDEDSTDDFLEPGRKAPIAKSSTEIFKTSPKAGNENEEQLNKVAPPKDTSRKANVSKLKMPNININVQALLPNAAGRPKVSNITDTAYSGDNEPTHQLEIPREPTENVTFPKTESRLEAGRENLLPNLCKNRVRGPLNRRASTRAGRKESYRKTLENEQREQHESLNSETSDAQSVKSKFKNQTTALPAAQLKVVTPPSHEKNIHSDRFIDSKPLKTTPLPSVSVITEIPTEIPNQQQASLSNPAINIGSKLFDDFDDKEENDDLFSSLIKPQTPNAVVEKNSIKKLLPDTSDESDDDLFQSSKATKKSLRKDMPQATKSLDGVASQSVSAKPKAASRIGASSLEKTLLESVNAKQTSNTVASSLEKTHPESAKPKDTSHTVASSLEKTHLESTKPKDMSHTVAASLEKTHSESAKPKDTSHTVASSQAKVQLESAKSKDASHTVVSSQAKVQLESAKPKDMSHTVATSQVKTPLESIKPKDTSHTVASSQAKVQLESAKPKDTSHTVASSQAKVQLESAKPKDTPHIVASSQTKTNLDSKKSDALFASDSTDDDDDLFRALSKSKPKEVIKPSSNIAQEVKAKSKSLFSDSEDDDDDLFGSSAMKIKKAETAKVTTAPAKNTTSSPQTLPTQVKTKPLAPNTADNPLADLFDT